MNQLNRSSRPFRAWLIWGLAAGFFFAEYFARVAPSVMSEDLMSTLHISALGLGSLSAFFYYAYVTMQLPVGSLIDRYGAHKLLTLTAGLCAVACFIFAHSHHLIIADAARFLMGLSAAFAFVGALKLASTWFPAARFGLLAGATQAIGMLGAAIGEGPVALAVKHIGWRHTMINIGLILLALAILIAIIVRDRPKGAQQKNSTPAATSSLWHNIVCVLKTKQCWINGLCVGFLYAPTAAFAELWGAPYMHRIYQIPLPLAATAISAIFIGFAISSPFSGWLSDKIKRRKPIMVASALLSLCFLSITLYAPHLSIMMIFILLFLYGMSNVGVSTAYAIASEIVPKDMSGTSMSFANMASVIIGALFQPIIGAILDFQAKPGAAIAHFSSTQYHHAMIVLPLCTLISLSACYFLRESYHRQP